MATAILILLILMTFIGILGTIYQIDKPRKPITRELAMGATVINVLFLIGYWYLWSQTR